MSRGVSTAQRNPREIPAGDEGTFILARQPARYRRQAARNGLSRASLKAIDGERDGPGINTDQTMITRRSAIQFVSTVDSRLYVRTNCKTANANALSTNLETEDLISATHILE